MSARPILEGVRLSKQFGGGRGLFRSSAPVRAVDDVSLAVQPGETLALVGESGSGKSTLGRLLLRLLPATAGDVLFEGRNIGALPAPELARLRRRMQVVFQDPFASLNPRMTVEAIVGEPIWLHRLAPAAERRDRVAALLDLVGLRPEQMRRRPHEFSGGQRQRIGIARALASEPVLILGDEPVSALDVSVQAQIVNLLGDLKARLGLTLLVVAHGLAVIRQMSDRVAVMYLGRIVELAPTEALFEAPLHPYTQALMAAAPVPDPRARRTHPPLGGEMPSPSAPPPGCHFHTRCPHVRPDCREIVPVLSEATDGRLVACHYWREIAAAGAGALAASPALAPAPGLARRLALFEAAQRRRETAPS